MYIHFELLILCFITSERTRVLHRRPWFCFCQFIEPVTFARCVFALRNITLGGYLDTRRNTWNSYGMMVDLKYIYSENVGH